MRIFEYLFMQRAFVVGILLAAVVPCVGMVVVCKRLSMIGDALSHTSLAGVAAGLLLGVNPVGITADASHFYTSSQATAFYLQENYPGQTVFCMGTRSLVAELEQNGIRVVTKPEDSASVVLIGFDTENTSEKVRDTCIMLGREVAYLATNPDLVCPVSFGYIPDCGSMSIMLKNATGKTPFFIGKPEPIMIDCVLKKLGISKEDTVIVGDRIYTDIACGVNAGVDTICVLSGEATLADLEKSDTKPTWIFDSVREVCTELAR